LDFWQTASAFVLGRGNHFHHHVYAEDHDHGHSHDHDHKYEHSHSHHKPDINIHSAFVHILADTLVTVLTVMALFAGRYFDNPRLDAIMALVGSVVILRWAYGLSRETLWDLLDGHAGRVDRDKLKSAIQDGNTKIVDLHVWRVAPKAHACEMVIRTSAKKGSLYYRKRILEHFQIKHLTIEEISEEG
jgi:Co/Zn/Cd efflux system component